MSLCIAWLSSHARLVARRRHDDGGQATVEYALVVLAAATIALLVLAWATGTGKVGQLLDAVFDDVTGKVG
jgi:Flp pilus assembly pilin Flp